jgi:hypothetical protein
MRYPTARFQHEAGDTPDGNMRPNARFIDNNESAVENI